MAKRYPWWLGAGTEACHACTHTYSYGMGLYCVACDRGLCMHCVVIQYVTREPWCRECSDDNAEA